jgi:hypothetical protein
MTKHRNGNTRLRRALAVLIAAAVSSGLVACGGGSDQATKLLRATFAGKHRINSGEVAVVLAVSPRGPSGLKGPIALGIVGPFQNLGPGRLPASVFNVSLDAMGRNAAVTLTSTGSTGYVTFQGESYKLPRATFQRLESSFAQLGSTPGASGSGVLGRLGIQPQRWLVHPQILGDEGVDGVDTTHIRSAINVAALLSDLDRFLKRAASLGEAGASSFPHGIPTGTRQRIAGEVKNPMVDVWTGVADKTLRRLQIGLTIPVSGQLSALLGRAASIALTMEYANLNQPQLITAPRKLLPYSVFQDKLRVLIADLEGGLAGGGLTGGNPSSGPNYQAYTNCVLSANGNLVKMQRCAPLLNGQ